MPILVLTKTKFQANFIILKRLKRVTNIRTNKIAREIMVKLSNDNLYLFETGVLNGVEDIGSFSSAVVTLSKLEERFLRAGFEADRVRIFVPSSATGEMSSRFFGVDCLDLFFWMGAFAKVSAFDSLPVSFLLPEKIPYWRK